MMSSRISRGLGILGSILITFGYEFVYLLVCLLVGLLVGLLVAAFSCYGDQAQLLTLDFPNDGGGCGSGDGHSGSL